MQIQKPELEITDAKVPLPLFKALKSAELTKISTQTIHKLVNTVATTILKQGKKDYFLYVNGAESTFQIGDAEIKTLLPATFSSQKKADLIKAAVFFHLGMTVAGNTLMDGMFDGMDDAQLEDYQDTANDSALINAGMEDQVEMKHKSIEDEATGVVTAPWLKDATHFYQSVRSTNEHSRYVFLAQKKGGTAKIAVRLKGDKCSVRMEPYTTALSADSDILGLNDNGVYASGHFDMGNTLSLKRYMAMMKAGLDTWEVAKFDETKIRGLSV